jgi:hypothetical protein
VLIAGLGGLMLTGASGPSAPQRHPAVHRATTPPPQRSTAQAVQVNADALTGQPVAAVAQQLRQLGLQVHVQMVRTGQQPPGTVVSVQPGGQLPAGSSVTVTGALPAGQDNGRHHDNGGGGNGQGGT